SLEKNGSVNGNNSTLDKNNDGRQTNLRQSQYLDSNRIKEEQNSQKRIDKNEDNNHNNNSSKDNLSKQNSNSNGHK
ncbi:hypothetical protein, partial [Clostridium sp.]